MRLKLRENPSAVQYFDAVQRRLRDVPWKERQDLLGDLVARLDELPPMVDPVTVLGDPTEYARLMREAAGYAPERTRRFAAVRATRPRTKILVVAIIVLAISLTTGSIAYTHYQPLRADSFMGGSSEPSLTANVPANITYYRYRPGGTVVTGMQLTNTGRVDITVTGVVLSGPPLGPLVLSALHATREATGCCLYEKMPRVQRFVVHPGDKYDTLMVVMKMVPFQIGAGSFISIDQPKLRTEVLGVHHLVSVNGAQIGLAGPPDRAP